jgi:flagella basal body P-ring formation protein FlgA
VRRAIPLALCLLAAPALAGPADGVSGQEAQGLVAEAMRAAGVSGGAQIAAARPLPACAHWPEVGPATPGDWRTVELRCTNPAWTRSLRTGAPMTRTDRTAPQDGTPMATGPGFVLRDSLSRGAIITAEDLAPAPAGSATPGQVLEADTLIGRRLAVNLAAGRVILARHLEQRWLIEAGAPVVIVSEQPGLSVSMAGEALDNGQQGDRIAVRNTRSGRVIEAEITGRDTVRVAANMN